MIDKNFIEQPAEKYWSFPSSYSKEKRKEVCMKLQPEEEEENPIGKLKEITKTRLIQTDFI